MHGLTVQHEIVKRHLFSWYSCAHPNFSELYQCISVRLKCFFC